VQAGDTAGSVSDTYTARTARERGRTVRQHLVSLACNCSDYTANDRSDLSPTTQGVAYLARNSKFESISLQRGVRCEPDFLVCEDARRQG
jgi:hypothetical protein